MTYMETRRQITWMESCVLRAQARAGWHKPSRPVDHWAEFLDMRHQPPPTRTTRRTA